MIDGFRFPRFDRGDFMDAGPGAVSNRNASRVARDCQSLQAIRSGFSLRWHAHLARDFTAGTAVPLSTLRPRSEFVR